VEIYCRAGPATDGNMAQRAACWINEVMDTQSEYVIVIVSPRLQNGACAVQFLLFVYKITTDIVLGLDLAELI